MQKHQIFYSAPRIQETFRHFVYFLKQIFDLTLHLRVKNKIVALPCFTATHTFAHFLCGRITIRSWPEKYVNSELDFRRCDWPL